MAAEQGVLGGMLLSKDAIADVVEILKTNDFYRPVHATIYDIVLNLYGRGEPADALTVAAALADSGDLQRIGGVPYLHTLIESVPTAANASYYARIVSERAILRRVVEAGTKIVQLGYGAGGNGGRDVDDIVDLAQQAIYDVTEKRVSEDFAALGDMLQPTLDEIEAVGASGGVMSGVPTGFADLDRLLNGLHPGQLIIVAGRPGLGKSTASMDFARNAAIRHGHASAIFSLEMSKIEMVMRLLSAEARVPLHTLRSGQLSDDDWTKLARRMGEISEAPIFVDDTPNMNLMEIRAKARRLKQRHNLKLLVIDYLQLMSSPKKTESRQQEVSELSRGLKLLAKEIECPVIGVSQLNRGPEQRTDKRPQLSDLRESGCLTAETRVLRADTGAETTMGELFASGARDVPVWALDERLKYVRRHLTHVFTTGEKPVFRMRLASGREIRATANHPFRTYDGWTSLGDLSVGHRIAAPRHVCAPDQVTEWADRQVVLLAHLLGDGSMLPRQSMRYASTDEANLEAVRDAATHFGITAARDDYPQAKCTTLRLVAPYRLTHGKRNPVAEWVDSLGLFGKRSHEKFVPPEVFSLPKEQIALFLRHLWATDGSVWIKKDGADGPLGRIYYASTSRRLVDDVARLLWRFGIQSRLKTVRKAGYRDGYQLHLYGAGDQEAFCRVIGVHGARGVAAELLRQRLLGVKANTNVDTIPRAVWERVRDVLAERRMPQRQFAAAMGTQFSGSTMWKHNPSRDRIARAAAILEDNELEMLATNDVTWDEIVAIEPDGVETVYDATVAGAHNFIANGIAVHNSIEQDADVVILLHRDDYYDKESPRAGEADFIVAKHRNGPTDTITVAAQLHLSRFVDMAI
ncbi:replicative DNA helicase [Actinoplanes awajinensis subsp. mycoplanecinus]|uniref:Replicative DNA helicase n=1 Tax=Actinoplanes awajinensis subsp. mycoplanecinus TaxID=135947 RepID=A0A101JGN2_9ACTN|nr:replicative DNA helicase [Actinoplanes awajinensis subsp. mycoplanecinus]